ncbi:MAG: sodium:solute symporter [Bacteroidales bacterium]|nr:sodium:solute symporter [Bacteroidales bacterium]
MKPWIVLATIAAYFTLLFIISALSNRNRDGGNFFGNRKTPWILAAIAAMGAPISGVTFISVPGMVVGKGFSYLQMVLGFVVGYFLVAYFLIPLFYRKNLKSIYGYLEDRFGASTHKTGAWFFFISKMLGASVRFFVVCVVLQSLVFAPLGVPFFVNVIVTIALIFLYTSRGGVKTVIWTDTLKSICLVASVVLCIIFIADGLGFDFGSMCKSVSDDPSSRIFFFDNPSEGSYFWKQFLAGIFMLIATTGLDQDLMQRNLSCRNFKESQKSLVVSAFTQLIVISLFLVLGVLLMQYYKANLIVGDNSNAAVAAALGSTDNLFGSVVSSAGMPVIVGILFILGLIAAAYSAAGSALTALTTSFTVDILEAGKEDSEEKVNRTRKWVHLGMAVCMGVVILVFNAINNQDAISAVYTLASYTYGPILGLFAFGMFCKKPVRDRAVPAVCIFAPLLSYGIRWALQTFAGYTVGFELLLLNAGLTVLGLLLLIRKK